MAQAHFEAPATDTAALVSAALKNEADIKEALILAMRKLKELADESSVSFASLVELFGPRIVGGESEVRSALARLVEDGEFFTTIDDDHFDVIELWQSESNLHGILGGLGTGPS